MTVRWKSNNQIVADRLFFIGRIQNGQMAIAPDLTQDRWVPVYDDGKGSTPVNQPPVGGNLTSSLTVNV